MNTDKKLRILSVREIEFILQNPLTKSEVYCMQYYQGSADKFIANLKDIIKLRPFPGPEGRSSRKLSTQEIDFFVKNPLSVDEVNSLWDKGDMSEEYWIDTLKEFVDSPNHGAIDAHNIRVLSEREIQLTLDLLTKTSLKEVEDLPDYFELSEAHSSKYLEHLVAKLA